jgi:hypothetical protein
MGDDKRPHDQSCAMYSAQSSASDFADTQTRLKARVSTDHADKGFVVPRQWIPWPGDDVKRAFRRKGGHRGPRDTSPGAWRAGYQWISQSLKFLRSKIQSVPSLHFAVGPIRPRPSCTLRRTYVRLAASRPDGDLSARKTSVVLSITSRPFLRCMACFGSSISTVIGLLGCCHC